MHALMSPGFIMRNLISINNHKKDIYFCSYDVFEILPYKVDGKSHISRLEVMRGSTLLGIGDSWHLEKVNTYTYTYAYKLIMSAIVLWD